MPVQRLIDESLLALSRLGEGWGEGLLQRCGWLILQQQAAVSD